MKVLRSVNPCVAVLFLFFIHLKLESQHNFQLKMKKKYLYLLKTDISNDYNLINPYPAKLIYLNFHPLEVLPAQQLQVDAI